MWIELNNKLEDGRPVTQAIKLEGMDEPVEFSESGKAQVTADVGEYLVNEVGSIEEVESESEDNTDE